MMNKIYTVAGIVAVSVIVGGGTFLLIRLFLL